MLMAVAPALNASIEFVGYFTSGETITFALVDTTEGRAKFVELGAHFQGYSVVEYTKGTETLTLKREGETLSVKLRSATFTIPAEVTGEEREKQFRQKLNEMLPKAGVSKKFYFIEDYLATATQFGREIVSFDVKDGIEVIVMELPEAKRLPPDKDGRVQKMNFMVQVPSRDKKTRIKLIVH